MSSFMGDVLTKQLVKHNVNAMVHPFCESEQKIKGPECSYAAARVETFHLSSLLH